MLTVRSALLQEADYAVRVRRALHGIPETGFSGVKTQAFLMDELKKTAPDALLSLAETGVKAVYRAENAKRTIAFRADTDALPITEQTGLAFASAHAGSMHACGHDGHMAMLLLFARCLMQLRASLKANVVLLFQPGEEGYGGADRMVREGALENPHVDEIYALHLWPALEKGAVGLCAGAMMASAQTFEFTVHGKSAHGATPHLGVDAIVIAAELISMLQTVVSRSTDPRKGALLTIGRIEGGEAQNIIAQRVALAGCVRALNDDTFRLATSRMETIANGLAAANNASITFERGIRYPCVSNPARLIAPLYALLGEENCRDVEPMFVSEDFSFYQQATAGAMLFLGTGDQAHAEPLHSPRFAFDESVLPVGAEIYMRILDAFSGQ